MYKCFSMDIIENLLSKICFRNNFLSNGRPKVSLCYTWRDLKNKMVTRSLRKRVPLHCDWPQCTSCGVYATEYAKVKCAFGIGMCLRGRKAIIIPSLFCIHCKQSIKNFVHKCSQCIDDKSSNYKLWSNMRYFRISVIQVHPYISEHIIICIFIHMLP